jgi:hypothetical protein
LFWFDKISQTWEISGRLTNIESLTNLGAIELTEIALKEIGLPEAEYNDYRAKIQQRAGFDLLYEPKTSFFAFR